MKKNLSKSIFSIYFIALSFFAYSQIGGVAINKTNANPHPSAMLDVSSTSAPYLGMLIPRMSTANRNAIASPATGLQVFNTDCGINEYYTGTCWVAMNQILQTPDHITCSGTTDLCANETRTFSIPPVTGATKYEWIVPAGANITLGQGSTSITVLFGKRSGEVCVRAGNLCESSANSCIDVYVSSLPVAPVASNNGPKCVGENLNLMSTTVTDATYSWTGPNSYSASIQNPILSSIALTDAGTYSVTASVNGCVSAAGTTSVTVNANPISSFTPSSGKTNVSMTFSPTTSGATYSWSFPGGSPTTSTSQNPAVTWSAAGSYNVSLTVTLNSCSTMTTNAIIITNPIVQTFNATGTGQNGSIQTFTVPAGVTTIKIDAYGARGGNSSAYTGSGGKGAKMSGQFTVTPGQILNILVGQQGPDGTYDGGGGGGTFVTDNSNNALIIAGGGGGAGSSSPSNGIDGTTSNNGTAGADGGTGGSGGSGGTSAGRPGAGGGFTGNGGDGWEVCSGGTGGKSFLNGGMGGCTGSNCPGGYGAGGGSHGMGWGGGGGGGYSGGGASQSSQFGCGGGGGGSYNIGTNQTNTSGVQTGNGQVVITY